MSINENVSRHNYAIACNILPRMVLPEKYPISEFLENTDSALSYYIMALKMTMRFHRITEDFMRFLSVTVHCIRGEGKNGVIYELAWEKKECNCNMVAILEHKDGRREYYTSEYYEFTDSFSLCSFADEGVHRAHCVDIGSAEDLAKALNCTITETVHKSPSED